MTIGNVKNFLAENAPRFRKLADREDVSIGFNAFSLVSDTYRRENFHSDIIAAILNPQSKHGEGTLFLQLFVHYLETLARNHLGKSVVADSLVKLSFDENISVKREEGRIDIKIEAADWVVIIENKINGADDMIRQLPQYLEKCGGRPRVKAIVYLTSTEEKYLHKYEWTPKDEKDVLPILIPVVGFSETGSVLNLVNGWLERCELAASNFMTRSVLAQYIELVKHQAGETMNQDEIKQVFRSLAENHIDYSELNKVLRSMPHILATMIADAFRDKEGVKKAWVYSDDVGVIDLNDIKPTGDKECVELSIDVECGDLDAHGISFFTRTANKVPLKDYESLLKDFDPSFRYDEKWGRIVLPVITNKAFGYTDAFLRQINSLVDFLNEKRTRLEKIAAGFNS